MKNMESIRAHLTAVYGQDVGAATFSRLQVLIETYLNRLPDRLQPGETSARGKVLPSDAILITYGDQVRQEDVPPLETLADFCQRHLKGLASGVHILPFYPYTSDDGFSVIDYKAVDPNLGDWNHIAGLGADFRLMFDAVINHISVQSQWFQRFLKDDPGYRDYFVVVDGAPDLSAVIRPRALPLLTAFDTPSGERAVWTTFSADQVDLNYQNPDVLLDVIAVLLEYAHRGAEFIRLDAIAFLWKEIGSTCLHLPQTHRIIQLMRAVLDITAPQVLLITETNVPHLDNISYFGDGSNEAQLVYNFALPPLVLHTLKSGDARVLAEWAASLELPSQSVTFFNFLASHDGIGLNPARGILSEPEIDALVSGVEAHGGLVSYKNNPDGSRSPYELNINYFDALSDPGGGESLSIQVDRFMVSQAVMLAVIGVPGIYFHSLFGSRGWPEGAAESGRNRTINRQKLTLGDLETALNTSGHLRSRVFTRYKQLLAARARRAAFHPNGSQEVVDASRSVFGVLRYDPASGDRVLCLHNVTDQSQRVELDIPSQLQTEPARLVDLLTGSPYRMPGPGQVLMQPYQVLWLGGSA